MAANKSELVELIFKTLSKDCKCTKKKCVVKCLDVVISSIATLIHKKKSLNLVGFGSFAVRNRKARKGRNPQTGKAITIKASKVVRFKAGKALKKGL